MGKKSSEYIAKYAVHPNWFQRLAALKVLMALNATEYHGLYAKLLEDKSLLVRMQTLEVIKVLNITTLAPYVWKMLYNKENFQSSKEKSHNSLVGKIFITIGSLKFSQAKKPLLGMIKNSKYDLYFSELNEALKGITDITPPALSQSFSNKENIRQFWIKKLEQDKIIY
jgi:hypothetical protein